ncbi:hypothetical protein ACFO8O_08655 [Hephaestia sp. GCM10023244]|uniref:hypothetical protein n=1 Tax=unclassified Hephaestia TaxID=2631281 RepID=UPI002077381F|nr:hypothetical protein [Hephaestia sp. MAHUQ-44]MCM8731027.1 hypothetical protein [Hephaestia sp. MAHUQ-44]
MHRLTFWIALGIAIGAGAAQILGEPAWILAGGALGAVGWLVARQRRNRGESGPET